MKYIRTVSKCIQTVYSNCILTVSQLKNIYAVYITYIYLIHICITSFKETLEFFFFWWGGGERWWQWGSGPPAFWTLPELYELCKYCRRNPVQFLEAIAMESFIDEIYDGTFTQEFSVLMLKLLKQFFFKTIEKLTLNSGAI